MVSALMLLAVACTVPRGEPTLEERALDIDNSLICPVCPSETINQSQVELAKQMRQIVREKLVEGWSRERILQFFVDRYGEDVLAEPPRKGFSLVAWVVPPLGLLLAAATLFFVLRSMTRGKGRQEEEALPPQEELEPYLSLVDRELGEGTSAQEAQKKTKPQDQPSESATEGEGK